MRGPKKDKVNLSEQGIVTEQALIAYLHNELSAEEKQELEKLLLEDPFAADALEGLKSSANQAAAGVSISSLRKKVRERSGLKERKTLKLHWVTFAWAAVVIGLLIGISFIMINFLNKGVNNPDLAVKEKKELENTPVLKPVDSPGQTERLKTSDSAAMALVPTMDTMPHAASGKADTTSKRRAVTTATGTSTVVVANGSTAPASGAFSVNSTIVSSLNESGSAQKSNPGRSDKDNYNQTRLETKATDSVTVVTAHKNASETIRTEGYKKEAKPDAKDIATLQENAMKNFNNGDYNTAGDDFDRILKSEPENADALYFGGICDYLNNKMGKSENNFDKLLKKGNKFIEGSKWYKANILLKKGKSEAAKSLLQDLSNGNSSYKERAIKKLAEMGF